MTDEQVQTAIAVLNAYTNGELLLDSDPLDALERAIEAAFNAMGAGGDGDYETPLTQSW
jgi:hypothetical protein